MNTTLNDCDCAGRVFMPGVDCQHMAELRKTASEVWGWPLTEPDEPAKAESKPEHCAIHVCQHADEDRTLSCWECGYKYCGDCCWDECVARKDEPLPESYLLRCNVSFDDGGTCGQPRGSCPEHDTRAEG